MNGIEKAVVLVGMVGVHLCYSSAVHATQSCGHREVMTALGCTPLNLCPDGSPWEGTRCPGVQVVPLPGESPGQPVQLCPDGTPMLPGRPCRSLRCPPGVRFFEESSPSHPEGRRVILSGEEKVSLLFERYLHRAKLDDVKIDLSSLEVIFREGDSETRILAGVHLKMGWMEPFAGMTWEKKWLRELGKKEAEVIPDAVEKTVELKADIVCED